jgi:transcription initiation factor TFIIIB Brf1 subunit/transcription initiation factor TFIIB
MAAVSVAYECRKNKIIRRIDEIAVAFRLSVSVFWKAYFRFETCIKEQAAKR